jgi:hypothetical protein
LKCREGHESTELDYCSVCGAAMPSAAATAAAQPLTGGPGAKAGGPQCPQCGEPRPADDARFCEVCRYDFVSRAPGPPPGGRASQPQVQAQAQAQAHARFELVLTIDPSLDEEPDSSIPPPNDPERVFPVEIAEMLVGRRDDRQNIRPAVPLNDPGASRRHAKFLLNADGSVTLQDLASMNGTKLNGKDVVSGSQQKLAAGDFVTLGRWTRITLRARA